ncbi:hypothetical protein FI667_g6548, partial [Globisporangium splendens]
MTSRTQVLLISSAIGRSRAKRGIKSPWVYELLLPDPLPILDLSISIKFHFLSRATLNQFNRFVARRKAIGLTGFASLVLYSLAIATRAEVGQICAIASALLLVPTIIAAVALFRCDVVKLLLRSYDFWFATAINTSTLAVFAVMIGGVRFLIPISTWTSIQVDIMIDASLRAAKVWQFLNVVGVVTHTPFDAKSHELPSSSFATSRLATLIAVIIRSVYRKRQESSDRSNRSLIDRGTSNQTHYEVSIAPICSTDSGLQTALNTNPSRKQRIDAVYRLCFVAWSDVSVSLRGVCLLRWLRTAAHPFSRSRPIAQLLALLLTVIYRGICVLHYQRKLLAVLSTSFDFVFLAIQLTVVHAGMCDLLRWNRNCIVALISWMWIHWVLCMDALTPIMKVKLSLQRRFALAVLLALVSSSLALMHYLIFADDAIEILDRVMLTHNMFGCQVDFRVLPLFYNCYVTTLMLAMRLIWRLIFNRWDVLLAVDGAVVYENYLRTATNRLSRRWGSVLQANEEAASISPVILKNAKPFQNRERT